MFSLGYNFDEHLVGKVARLNQSVPARRVRELYGAVQLQGVPSARPSGRLPRLSPDELQSHIESVHANGMQFNYLLNGIGIIDHPSLEEQIDILRSVGIKAITVATPELGKKLRDLSFDGHLTLSLTARASTVSALEKVADAGIQAAYLDALTVNRDFPRLRELIAKSKLELRLYANLSCLKSCPVVEAHYKAFQSSSTEVAIERNDSYFRGCSMVKLSNPVEWLQMPWIRPEDIVRYNDLGFTHFKLSDRLASTDTLMMIARYYVSGHSPANLFQLIERNSAKFGSRKSADHELCVRSDAIPTDFLDHFEQGECSGDVNCSHCKKVAKQAIPHSKAWEERARALNCSSVPKKLRQRAGAQYLSGDAKRELSKV